MRLQEKDRGQDIGWSPQPSRGRSGRREGAGWYWKRAAVQTRVRVRLRIRLRVRVRVRVRIRIRSSLRVCQ